MHMIDYRKYTREQISKVIRYEPNHGRLYRIMPSGTEKDITDNNADAIKVMDCLCQKNYLCHLLHTGEWPVGTCSHLNKDKRDYRWINLRFGNSAKYRLSIYAVRDMLEYSPKKGTLKWRVHNHRAVAGSNAGYPRKDGTIVVSICGHQYTASSLIIFMECGLLPKKVSYRDGDRTNLRRDNLYVPVSRIKRKDLQALNADLFEALEECRPILAHKIWHKYYSGEYHNGKDNNV
jgi:hypothetical protein